jgi:CheY-like chemotaxis protein
MISILFIDDDTVRVEQVEMALKDAGFSVEHVIWTENAWDELKDKYKKYNIILLDLIIPRKLTKESLGDYNVSAEERGEEFLIDLRDQSYTNNDKNISPQERKVRIEAKIRYEGIPVAVLTARPFGSSLELSEKLRGKPFNVFQIQNKLMSFKELKMFCEMLFQEAQKFTPKD